MARHPRCRGLSTCSFPWPTCSWWCCCRGRPRVRCAKPWVTPATLWLSAATAGGALVAAALAVARLGGIAAVAVVIALLALCAASLSVAIVGAAQRIR